MRGDLRFELDPRKYGNHRGAHRTVQAAHLASESPFGTDQNEITHACVDQIYDHQLVPMRHQVAPERLNKQHFPSAVGYVLAGGDDISKHTGDLHVNGLRSR